MSLGNRLFRFIVGLDQALDPLIYGGSENITISSMTAYKEMLGGKRAHVARLVIDFVFDNMLGQTFHCYSSLWSEKYEFATTEQPAIQAFLAAKPDVAAYLGITA